MRGGGTAKKNKKPPPPAPTDSDGQPQWRPKAPTVRSSEVKQEPEVDMVKLPAKHTKAKPKPKQKSAPRETAPRAAWNVCWDYHSRSGCARGNHCPWKHGPLDSWQESWLKLSRFVFGGQEHAIQDIDDLTSTVHEALGDMERNCEEPSQTQELCDAFLEMAELGYPFAVVAPVCQEESEDARRSEAGDSECSYSTTATCSTATTATATTAATSTISSTKPANRSQLLNSLCTLARLALGPDTQALPVGSCAWGLDSEGSDFDIVLSVKDGTPVQALACVQQKLQKLVEQNLAPPGLQGAEAVLYDKAAVPVLTLSLPTHNGTSESHFVDVCVNQLSSIRDTIIFRHLLVGDPEMKKVLMLLKRFLRTRAIPSGREGGYPSLFWMRLAAQTYQDEAKRGKSKALNRDIQKGRLRIFFERAASRLPAFGEPIHLAGEVATCQAVRRLGAGVFAPTSLLCAAEMWQAAIAPWVLVFTPAPLHRNLCPAEPGFWGVFLCPPIMYTMQGCPRLVLLRVDSCFGAKACLRSCRCSACVGSASLSGAAPVLHVSRRESDWIYIGGELAVDFNEGTGIVDVHEADARLAVGPQHFVCSLGPIQGSIPEPEALAWFQHLQVVCNEPTLQPTLAPTMPLMRYGRGLLLSMRPQMKPDSDSEGLKRRVWQGTES